MYLRTTLKYMELRDTLIKMKETSKDDATFNAKIEIMKRKARKRMIDGVSEEDIDICLADLNAAPNSAEQYISENEELISLISEVGNACAKFENLTEEKEITDEDFENFVLYEFCSLFNLDNMTIELKEGLFSDFVDHDKRAAKKEKKKEERDEKRSKDPDYDAKRIAKTAGITTAAAGVAAIPISIGGHASYEKGLIRDGDRKNYINKYTEVANKSANAMRKADLAKAQPGKMVIGYDSGNNPIYLQHDDINGGWKLPDGIDSSKLNLVDPENLANPANDVRFQDFLTTTDKYKEAEAENLKQVEKDTKQKEEDIASYNKKIADAETKVNNATTNDENVKKKYPNFNAEEAEKTGAELKGTWDTAAVEGAQTELNNINKEFNNYKDPKNNMLYNYDPEAAKKTFKNNYFKNTQDDDTMAAFSKNLRDTGNLDHPEYLSHDNYNNTIANTKGNSGDYSKISVEDGGMISSKDGSNLINGYDAEGNLLQADKAEIERLAGAAYDQANPTDFAKFKTGVTSLKNSASEYLNDRPELAGGLKGAAMVGGAVAGISILGAVVKKAREQGKNNLRENFYKKSIFSNRVLSEASLILEGFSTETIDMISDFYSDSNYILSELFKDVAALRKNPINESFFKQPIAKTNLNEEAIYKKYSHMPIADILREAFK